MLYKSGRTNQAQESFFLESQAKIQTQCFVFNNNEVRHLLQYLVYFNIRW